MGAEQGPVETDAGDPLQQQAGILAGGEASVFVAAAMEQEIAGTLPGRRKVLVDAWRVCSVISNLTGRPVLLCRTVARSTA